MVWIIVGLCLIGMYKSVKGYLGCMKANAFGPAIDQFILLIIFVTISIIVLKVANDYSIQQHFEFNGIQIAF